MYMSYMFVVLLNLKFLVSGVWINFKKVDCDYSHWLGPDYKEKYKKGLTAPIVVSNHITHMDPGIVFSYSGTPCFSGDI